VFERVNPEALQQCFLAWVNQVVEATGAQVIPIDGKSVKGSYRSKKAVSLTSGECLGKFASTLLGQVKVENKSNEITAIPALPNCLILLGASSIDAIGTQTEIAGQIVAKDYILIESEPPHPLRSGESVV